MSSQDVAVCLGFVLGASVCAICYETFPLGLHRQTDRLIERCEATLPRTQVCELKAMPKESKP